MTVATVIELVALFLSGLLAGEEFVVRYGVQPALSAMPDLPHVLARQALVRRLRILVPALMVPTVLLAITALIVGGTSPGVGFRWAALAPLVAFLGFSFLGTVPINIRVNDWTPDAPPADWKDVVRRWERIDVFRSSAAILAFAAALLALAFDVI
ncbi:anthrone oxygenase family protein [Herbiconiux sp. P16]|uniref:anthrone oxygenase family protein n=1 Tax=Herbiconiux wuyangfengii TaxID=3342794 RepID=UPI0035B812AA